MAAGASASPGDVAARKTARPVPARRQARAAIVPGRRAGWLGAGAAERGAADGAEAALEGEGVVEGEGVRPGRGQGGGAEEEDEPDAVDGGEEAVLAVDDGGGDQCVEGEEQGDEPGTETRMRAGPPSVSTAVPATAAGPGSRRASESKNASAPPGPVSTCSCRP